MDFYPRPPRGGRRRIYMLRSLLVGFLSTPSARRATHTTTKQEDKNHISIHALREEGDDGIFFISLFKNGFLSTPSARRATHLSAVSRLSHPNFYPRPPRGGRPHRSTRLFSSSTISIHALREEGDYNSLNGWATDIKFLSTPSARRATKLVEQRPRRHYISIHALREEGDSSSSTRTWGPSNFYPRPPRGGRRRHRRATGCETTDFYPRPPRGGRPRVTTHSASA